MLRLIPETRVAVIERCSGHGGIWGTRTENFDVAVKVGKPAAQAALKNNTSHVASECPLAGEHLVQVMEMAEGQETPKPFRADHPIEIFARAYGLEGMSHDATQDRAVGHHPARRVRPAACRARASACAEIKKDRRLEVGPFATFYFECYDTMLHQVQEMLFIEKGGEEQIEDELAAYNPLIPQGSELVATVMFEIDDPVRRARVLGMLGGVEDKAFIRVGGDTIRGVAGGRPGPHPRGRQGLVGAVHALSLHRRADRGVPQRRRRRDRGLRSCQLRPHGGDAAGRAPGAVQGLRLKSAFGLDRLGEHHLAAGNFRRQGRIG